MLNTDCGHQADQSTKILLNHGNNDITHKRKSAVSIVFPVPVYQSYT